ncbi:TolC family protein [Pontibacter sp. G13]|uniref:TolC family protein n=1 Tax=Pontibacter sp. G13 TaxID=3074898 RepID=UPI0028896679|nr:TolC family protein [Pontibacter sp. G13]WNJ16202.1 TolC family protein [Pontibacter sp. G13]
MNFNLNTFGILLVMFIGIGSLQAQDKLSLEQAVTDALTQNYGIRIARMNTEATTIDAYKGNAGLLPTVTLDGNGSYNRTDGSIVFQQFGPDGAPVQETFDINGNESQQYTIGATVNYTLFNGFANQTNYQILLRNVDLSEAQTRATVEANIAQVVNAYYLLARNTNTLRIRKETLDRSKARLEYAQNQAEFGATSKLNVLNAEVDFNTDSINVVNAELDIVNARKDLNLLLGRDIEDFYAVDTTVTINSDYQLGQLQDAALSENPQLQTARMSQNISELQIKLAKSGYYPRVNLNAGYSYTYSANPASQTPEIQTYGPTAGGGISFNLWNANRTNRSVQKAQVSLAASRMQVKEQEQMLLRDLSKAYATYRNNMNVLELSYKSQEAATANFERTAEAFKLGQATNLQFREAQLNLLSIENQLNDLQYIVKASEAEMLRLSGLLVQD